MAEEYRSKVMGAKLMGVYGIEQSDSGGVPLGGGM